MALWQLHPVRRSAACRTDLLAAWRCQRGVTQDYGQPSKDAVLEKRRVVVEPVVLLVRLEVIEPFLLHIERAGHVRAVSLELAKLVARILEGHLHQVGDGLLLVPEIETNDQAQEGFAGFMRYPARQSDFWHPLQPFHSFQRFIDIQTFLSQQDDCQDSLRIYECRWLALKRRQADSHQQHFIFIETVIEEYNDQRVLELYEVV